MIPASEINFFKPYWNFFEHFHFKKIRRETLFFSSTFYAGIILLSTFILLAISGFLLMYYYIPTENESFRSIRFLEEHLRYGGLMRSLHNLTAHLMVFALFLHLISLILRKAYLKKKWANWLVGMLLFLLTIMLSYTGYLLPYDQLGYWAIMVGSNMAGSAPFIGSLFKQFMIGGDVVSDTTLIRFYVHHCITIPVIFCLFLSIHLYRIRKDKGLTLLKIYNGSKNYIQSWPNIYIFEIGFFIVISFLLILISLYFQTPLGAEANPAVTPNPMKAPWYLVGLQELLHFHSPFVVSYLIPGIIILTLSVLPLLPERYKTLTINESTLGSKIFIYSMLGYIIFISVVPAYHINFFFLIHCLVFLVIFYFSHSGRSLNPRFGKVSVLSFVLLFLFAAYVIATLIGNYFRGPNWEFIV